jgi:hypothetical protein
MLARESSGGASIFGVGQSPAANAMPRERTNAAFIAAAAHRDVAPDKPIPFQYTTSFASPQLFWRIV